MLHWLLPGAGMLAFAVTLILGNGGIGFFLLCLGITGGFEFFYGRSFRQDPVFGPYLALLFSPLLLLNFSSIIDFRVRAFSFLLLVLLFNAAAAKERKNDLNGGVISYLQRFSLSHAKPAVVWLVAFSVFVLASVLVTVQGVHLSGDEPHYVVISQSIVDDGDFDLKNNFDDKTYRDFAPVDLRFHGGEYDGKALSFHLPGVSFLLVPFYALFKLLGLGSVMVPALFFRIAASVINAFFALCLFYILKMKFPGKDVSRFWFLMITLYPLLFHSIHLYPELPGATLMMAGYIFAFREKKNYLLSGLFLSFVPWFHVKYIPALGILALAILYNMWKEYGKGKNKGYFISLLQLAVFPALLFLLLIVYSKMLYGSYSPTDIFPKESYWSTPWLLRLKVFFSYFIDQRDGLLLYAPLFFLFILGFRGKWKDKYLFLGIASIYVFFHAFTTVRGAYAPAGRPLMFVSWVLILLLARYYFQYIAPGSERPGPLHRFGFRALTGFSFFVLAWLFYYPLFVYQPVFAATQQRASLLNLFLGSNTMEPWKFFPSFLTRPLSSHEANAVWIALIILLATLFYIVNHRRTGIPAAPAPRLPRVIPPVVFVMVLGLGFLYAFHPHIHLSPRFKYKGEPISFFNNSRNFTYADEGTRKGFRIKSGNNYDIYIDRKISGNKTVTLYFNYTDVTDVKIRNGKRLLFETSGKKQESFTLPLSSLTELNVGHRRVSHLGFETRTDARHAFVWLEIK